MSQLPIDQTPEGWNRTSQSYDEDLWDFMQPFVAEIVERAKIEPTHDVLDVAAGTGALTLLAAPACRRVLAADFAEEMLACLRRRVEEAGLSNVEIEQMDGQALTVEDQSFDAVCSNFGVIFFPDRVKGMSEMYRALRPGGRAVISAWSQPERFEALGAFMGAVRTAFPDLPKPPAPPAVFSLADAAQFEEELRAAGFEDVKIDSVSHALELESGEAVWEQMSGAAPPVTVLFEKVGPEGVDKIRTTLLSQLSERFGDGPIRLVNEAHIATAVR